MNLRINISILLLLLLGNFQYCYSNTDSLLNALNNTENPEKKADLFNELADFYLYASLDSALSYAQKAITVSKNASYQKGEIYALIIKSDIYREKGEYHKAKNCADRVNSIAENLTDKDILAKYHMLAGSNFFEQHSYNKALEQFKVAFDLFSECGDLSGMGDAQRNIGHALHYWQEWEVIYEYYLSALDCYKKAGDQRGISAILSNIGVYYYIGQHDYKTAESYILKAVALNKKSGNVYWLSKNYMILSGIKEYLDQVDSSFYYSKESLHHARIYGNPLRVINSLIDQGILYQTYKSDSIAIEYYYEALHMAETINSYVSLGDVADYIRGIYFSQGLIDSAYFYLEKHYEYADSLNNNNSEVKFAELKYQMETALEKQKIAMQNQRRFFIYLVVFLGLTLVIIILFLLYTRQKIKTRNTLLEKENLANKMELKNKELASNILVSQKKNEILVSVIKNIENSKDLFPKESMDVIEQVVKNLKDAGDDKGWEDFELVFSQVHESFFTKLDQLFPGLSQKERRLCALLRLNMSSKQIAEATQMTPQSVDTARYRLRKKLNIENPATDLVSFLRKI